MSETTVTLRHRTGREEEFVQVRRVAEHTDAGDLVVKYHLFDEVVAETFDAHDWRVVAVDTGGES